MARGDQVVVRTYGDKPRIRRVWDVFEDSILIVTDENYQKLTAGVAGLWPVALDPDDVFVYNPATFPAETEGVPQPEAFWARLRPYRAL
jgi:hypothetical protein